MADSADHCVEPPTPLPSSVLWDLQTAFYAQQGSRCWTENAVPSFMSSNAFLASGYARVLLGFARDWYARGEADRSQPLYVFDVGAGSGRLGFLVAREIMEAWQAWPDLGRDGGRGEGGGVGGGGADGAEGAEVDLFSEAHTAVRPYGAWGGVGVAAAGEGRGGVVRAKERPEGAAAPSPAAAALLGAGEAALVAGPHPGGPAPSSSQRPRRPRISGSGARSFGHGPGGRRCPFRLVLTDSCEDLVPFWSSHESLAPLVEAGIVDFAAWDAEGGGGAGGGGAGGGVGGGGSSAGGQQAWSMRLSVARGEDGVSPLVLGPSTLANPVLGMANYTLNTLRQGVFRFSPAPSSGPAPGEWEGGSVKVEQGCAAIYTDRPEDAERVFEWQHQRKTKTGGSVAGTAAEEDAAPELDGSIISRMRVAWSFRPVRMGEGKGGEGEGGERTDGPSSVSLSEACGADPVTAAVVRAYAARMSVVHGGGSGPGSGVTVTLPVGGLAAMRRLATMRKAGGRGAAGGDGGTRLFFLVGDKSFAQEEEVVVQGSSATSGGSGGGAGSSCGALHVAVHGSFSFMANVHSLRLAGAALGPADSFALHTPYLDGFKVSGYLWSWPAPSLPPSAGPTLASTDDVWRSASSPGLPPRAAASWPEMTLAWADAMDTFGPDNFATLQRCIRDEVGPHEPSLRLALATVRMSCWDPDVAFKFKQTMIEKSPQAPERLQADVYRDVVAIYARYYPLMHSKDMAFELGRVCMGVRRYHEAISLFAASARHTGEHHITIYNIGICLYHIGSPDFLRSAKAAFVRTLVLRPDYADAESWKLRVDAKLEAVAEAEAEAARVGIGAGAGAGAGGQSGEKQKVAGGDDSADAVASEAAAAGGAGAQGAADDDEAGTGEGEVAVLV